MQSRYDNIAVVYTDRRGEAVRGRELRPNPSWAFNFTRYAVREGDRIDIIADSVYGDPEMWYLIADANPDVLDWFQVSPGLTLRIPYVLA